MDWNFHVIYLLILLEQYVEYNKHNKRKLSGTMAFDKPRGKVRFCFWFDSYLTEENRSEMETHFVLCVLCPTSGYIFFTLICTPSGQQK